MRSLNDFKSRSAGNRCYFVLLDKNGSCPTADLSNIGRPTASGPAGPTYSTGELLNTPQVNVQCVSGKCTVFIHCLKKGRHFYFCNNFSKCWPMLIILSLLYSQIYCMLRKMVLKRPPHLKSVAVLPCETWVSNCTTLQENYYRLLHMVQ